MKEDKNKEQKQTINPFPQMEEEVLYFWEQNKIFQKSIENPPAGGAPLGDYIFYDGPPFATGEPHYGHIVASLMKDAVPRYWTMKGYRIERKWGWDCHGLPIENIAEKELGITHKKEIEAMGVDKFNEYCRSKVLAYVDIWNKVIPRLGRWVDMDNPYKTMDLPFMESVWWVFKQLWDRGLIYENYRSMYICPRCETTLSQSEVAEGYKDVKDLSVTVKFELVGEPGTFILAWTTTPWTLIGNVALAVGEDIVYIKVKDKISGERYILAEERYSEVLKYYPEEEKHKYFPEKKIMGKDLVGKKYKPVFDYYAKDKNLPNHKNGWQVYAADFVTTEDGTGVVHIAPAFGEDDMNLGKQYNLPFIQHVGMDGVIKKEAGEFAGLHVKPIEDVQATDVKIIKYLDKEGVLFAKEKYEHSYPHCWRCETPLINYATTSWFVKVTAIKDKMLDLAKNINWSPEYIKEGRFGNWLEGARDWSISRQRYWASVIPLWKCEGIKNATIILLAGPYGSGKTTIAELLSQKDKYVVINGDDIRKELFNDIKIKSKKDYEKIAKVNDEIIKRVKKIKEDKIIVDYVDLVFNLERYKSELGNNFSLKVLLPRKEVLVERDKIRMEWHNGEEFTKADWDLFNDKKAEWGEKDYIDNSDISADETINKYFIRSGCGEMKVIGSVAELEELSGTRVEDLHKHIVDKITFSCAKCGGTMKRIPDVIDTWFDSGSMPYAQMHYPFENKAKFEKNFPAKFIAEGVDQTRCWFYYLHVIASGIKDSEAYKNVIVNGIVLAEDGKKMAKRLKNYPDPTFVFDKYGADAMRYYLLSSSVMLAENLNFSEKGVSDVLRNVNMILWNVYEFYSSYTNVVYKQDIENYEFKSKNILDKWILARLSQLISEVTENMDNYNLPKATRPIAEFINDLSTWYLRRSRSRFKYGFVSSFSELAYEKATSADHGSAQDRDWAVATTGYVLRELSKVVAPFMPFIAEQLWQKVTGNNFKDENKSVHLENWLKYEKAIKKEDKEVLEIMKCARTTVRLGLSARDLANVKVRQPLSLIYIDIKGLTFQDKSKFEKEVFEIIKEEINVKEIQKIADNSEKTIKRERTGVIHVKWEDGREERHSVDKDGDNFVSLVLDLTPELKLEGIKRDLVRAINNLRKDAGMTIQDKATIHWQSDDEMTKEVFEKMRDEILKDTLSTEINEGVGADVDLQKEVKINGIALTLGIKKN